MNDMLRDRVVIVTGGAGLLGKEFIRAVVEAGGYGIIADIDEGSGKKAMRSLQNELASGNIDFVKVDITSVGSVNRMIAKVSRKYGKIDALVNNAYPKNKNFGRKFENVAYGDFCENIDMHLGGYFLCSQQMAAFFKKRGHGNIVNMASIYGVIAPRFEIYDGTAMGMPVEYAVIKSAVIHLTRYMAKYFKGSGIRVNSISPGGILDKQDKKFLKKYNDLCLSKGMLDKSDIAGTLIYLLSDASRYVNGQNIIVDDGFCL